MKNTYFILLSVVLIACSCSSGNNNPSLENLLIDQEWKVLETSQAFYLDSEDGKLYETSDTLACYIPMGEWSLVDNKIYLEYVDPPFQITELYAEIDSYSTTELYVNIMDSQTSKESINLIYNLSNGEFAKCITCEVDSVMHDNHMYSTVKIGNQCWLGENLNYMPNVYPPNDISEDEPRYYVYHYLGNNTEEAKNTNTYKDRGVLYNGAAILNGNICPQGWKVPEEEQFNELIDKIDETSSWWDRANKLKDDVWWNGTDDYNFSANPAGRVILNDTANMSNFVDLLGSTPSQQGNIHHAYFWSKNLSALRISNDEVNINSPQEVVGYSCRCISKGHLQ